jgi:hypothetical protein
MGAQLYYSNDDNALLVNLFKNAIKINENIQIGLAALSTAHNDSHSLSRCDRGAVQPNTICQLNDNRTINLHIFVAEIFKMPLTRMHEVNVN